MTQPRGRGPGEPAGAAVNETYEHGPWCAQSGHGDTDSAEYTFVHGPLCRRDETPPETPTPDTPPVDAQPVEPLTAEELIEKLGRAADSIKPEPGMGGPHGGYLGGITRQKAVAAIEAAMEYLDAARAGDGLDVASIRSSRYPIDHLIGDLANTALGMQYVNPNGREDAYNQGVRDLIAVVADRLRALAVEGASDDRE